MSARISGLGAALAAAGLAHFAKPEAFESITATAFPNHTRRYTYVNGGIETAGQYFVLRRYLAHHPAPKQVVLMMLNPVEKSLLLRRS